MELLIGIAIGAVCTIIAVAALFVWIFREEPREGDPVHRELYRQINRKN